MTRTIGIFLFDNVEVLDFAGPYEVFTCANRVYRHVSGDTSPPFRVLTIAQDSAEVRARAGLRVLPDMAYHAAPDIDVLIVPGGVVQEEIDKPEVIAWIAGIAGQAELVASVCSGALLLAKAGLLDGREATTHWEDIKDLRQMFPKVQVQAKRRWVDQGDVITSAGISAGMDMALYLLEKLVCRELALHTAMQMEYNWNENNLVESELLPG